MATVQKVREQVFLISWNIGSVNYYDERKRTCHTSVDINDISQQCKLICSTQSGNNSKDILRLEISPIHDSRIYYCHQLNNARKPPIVTRNFNRTPKVLLTPSSVTVMMKGVSQPMTLKNSTWTTEILRTLAVNLFGAEETLYVLIDFNSTSSTKSKRVLDHLSNLWETKTLADITFKFDEKEIQAHTLIIASGSPVLAALFQNDSKEKQERVVVIKDVKSSVFEKMLRFFYTGDADLDNVDLVDLLMAANEYGVESLKQDCALYMAQNLTVKNVVGYLVASRLHKSPNLYKAALEFISQNSEAIVLGKDWVDLMKNHHELSLAAVQMMVLTKKKTGPQMLSFDDKNF